jgi:integrase
MVSIAERNKAMGIVKKGQNLYRIDAHVLRKGREYRRRELFDGTKAKAEERYLQLKKELRDGCNAERSLKSSGLSTFGDLLKIYKEKRGQDCATSHVNKIEFIDRELGSYELPCFADRFEQYIQLMKTTNSPKTKRPRSHACINRCIQIVRAAFNMAVSLGLLEKNPITTVRFPRLKEMPRDVILSDADIKNLLSVIDREAPHLSAIVRFALQVPCRKSELVNMTKGDLDLIHNAIRVKAEVSKNDRGCWKPIPPDMVSYFRNLPPQTEYLFYRVVKYPKSGETKYFGLGEFSRPWRRCLKLAKLTGLHFHDTRHMAATALIDNGTPEQAVMTVANWKTNMLRNYYHRDPKRALELVRFSSNLGHFGHFLDTSSAAVQ